MKKLYFLLLLFIIVSCTVEEQELPIPKIMKVHNFSNENVLYHYFEKFGFTDICLHNRILVKMDSLKTNQINWYSLPIQNIHLELINGLNNKLDSLISNEYTVLYDKQLHFSDISLGSNEFIKVGVKRKDCTLQLQKGYYYYDNHQFLIYDQISKLLYCEVHQCDGL